MQPWGRQREVEKPKLPPSRGTTQIRVNELPEHQQQAAMDECDQAIEQYPAIKLSTGQRLHVFETGGRWSVWLNCEDADFTGICVAADQSTRDSAIAEAVRVFEAASDALQGPVRA